MFLEGCEHAYQVLCTANEPKHDKTNKMTCAHSEDSDQPGHLPNLIKSLRCGHGEALSPWLSIEHTMIRLGRHPG